MPIFSLLQRTPVWLRACCLCLLWGAAVPLFAQVPSTVIDFENLSGTVTTDPFLDELGVAFGVPSVTLSGLPSTVVQRLGPITIFTDDNAPSGTNVAANCTGGIGCEFPGDAVGIQFDVAPESVSFMARGFFGPDDLLRVYAYDESGQVELVEQRNLGSEYERIDLAGAPGYVIDAGQRTIFIDDLSFIPGQAPFGLDCGTGDDLLERLQEDTPFRLEYDRIRELTAAYLAGLAINDEVAFGAEVITIPVVVHVVHNNSAENISDAQVQSQIDALNEAFRATNADISTVPAVFAPQVADLQIQFALAQRDPDCEPTNGITRTETTLPSFGRDPDSGNPQVRNPVKFNASGGRDGWPSNEYLNIWVCDLSGGLYGYAAWPADFAARPAEDGVVMDYQVFGTTGSLITNFDRGRVCVHEVGHWLNLRHIWGDDQREPDVCSGTDEVDDTPNHGIFNRDCPTFPSTSCDNGPNGDMFMNYMDYTDNTCMNMFTLGQHVRAAASLFTVRTELIGSPGLLPPPETPTQPDLWSADSFDDVGDEPNASTEPMYRSADIWVRPTNDGLTNQEHVNPVYRPDGSPNYVYVRVRNRGCGGTESGTTRLYWAKASSGLSWPSPWDGSVTSPALMGNPIGAQAVSVDGGEFTVLEFPWVVPNPEDYASFGADRAHFCLLSRIEDADGMTFPETTNLWSNVINNNNIVWKNISIGEADESSGFLTNQLIVANYEEEDQFVNLRFRVPESEVRDLFEFGRVFLYPGEELFARWEQNGANGDDLEVVDEGVIEILGSDAQLEGIELSSGDILPIEVRYEPFEQTRINATFRLDFEQVVAQTERIIGGNEFWWRTFAEGVQFPTLNPGTGNNTPPIFVDCPEEVATNCEFPLIVRVDMSNVPAPDQALGNFTMALQYDPTVMELVGESAISSAFGGFINEQPGLIIFNGVSLDGEEGDVAVFGAIFRAIGNPGTPITPTLDVRVLVSAGTFTDLSETASIFNCESMIVGDIFLGDVNNDGLINSTDAALVIAFSVGNSIPVEALERILEGVGDVNGDGETDVFDALIILTYDVGLPVEFPVGVAVCPSENENGLLPPESFPVSGRSSLKVPVIISKERTENQDLILPLTVNMTETGEALGSYQLKATWNPQRYEFVGFVPATEGVFIAPTVNQSEVARGRFRMAQAHPGGSLGEVALGALRLKPLTDDNDEQVIQLDISGMATARSLLRVTPDVRNAQLLSVTPAELADFSLQASPNPTRGATVLTVNLPQAEVLSVSVFDTNGREIARLFEGNAPAGIQRFEWSAASVNKPSLTGIYFVRAHTATRAITKRLVIIR